MNKNQDQISNSNTSVNSDVIIKTNKNEQYKTHFYSYIILFLYFVQNYLVGTFQTSLGSLIDVFNKLYHINSTEIAFTVTILSISFGVMSIPFSYLSRMYGLRFSILISNLLFIIGSILRLMINKYTILFYIGFIFLGIGCPLIVNSQLKLINSWVSPGKRNIMNALVSVISPIGAGTGQILPLFFVDKNEMNKEILKNQIFRFFMFYLISMIIIFILNFIFLFDKPKSGYGNLNESQFKSYFYSKKTKKKKFFEDMKFVMKKPKFILACLIYAFGLATVGIIGTNINPIVEQFSDNNILGILICIIAIFSGLICAFIFSLFIQKKLSSKLSIQILYNIAILGLLVCTIGLDTNRLYLVYIGSALLGGGIFSHCSVIIEYLTIRFGNINFFIINSFLVIFQQIIQSGFIVLVGFLVSFQIKYYSLWCCLFIQSIYFIIIILSLFLN